MISLNIRYILMTLRHHSRISQQSYIGCFGRSYRNPKTRRCRLSSYSRTFSRQRPARISWSAVRVFESRIFASHRAWRPTRHESIYSSTYAYIAGRSGEGGRESICCKDKEMESTRAIQGKRHIRQWRDY